MTHISNVYWFTVGWIIVIISPHKQYEIFIDFSLCLLIINRTVCELCKSAFLSTKDSGKFYDDVTLKDVNILLDKILIKANEEEVCVTVLSNHPHCLRIITPITVKLVCFEVEPFHSTSALVKGTTTLLKH